jgi:hypothetical protein
MTRNRRARLARLGLPLILFVSLVGLRADQVEMQNGDRYLGKIISVNTNTVVLQSEVLGTVTLPRNKIAGLTLGSGASTNLPPIAANGQLHPPLVPPATAPRIPVATKKAGAEKSVIQQVESQYLSEATPEVRQKFNQMAGGLLTGRLTVNDIRKEAKSAADQLRALRGDAGDDTGMIDSYLAILDSFLKESPLPGGAVTNAAASPPKVKPGAAHEEE